LRAHGYTSAMSIDSKRIRVLVAEDNVDLASAVSELLGTEPDIDVVGVVGDASSLCDSVRVLDAQVVILDLNLSGGSSVPAMQAVRRERPRTGIVVYSGYDRADLASALPTLGDCECVSKSGEVTDLIDAVRRTAQRNAAGTGR
jgi:DNA-binding NarL/FixJ family response regulator